MRSASNPIFSMTRVRRATAALAILFILLTVLGIPASAQRPNGAGVVVRHGDGTLIMAYVQFEEESISGNALLEKTGLQITAAPYGGLGTGICMIDNEGCPADNCYCESYDNPAEFWQYYSWDGSAWVLQPFGPSSREIGDGDIDGWSWTAGDPGLPPVSIDEIASLNGVDRNPATPTPEPPPPTETPVPPTPTPVPPTATPEPTATQPPPPTTVEASPTPAPQPTDAPTATVQPAASETPPAATESLAATPTPAPATTVTASPTESDEARAQDSPSPSPTSTATEAPTSVAVIITPGSTPQALVQESRDEGGSSSLLIFGLMAGAVVLVGGGIAGLRWRQRG